MEDEDYVVTADAGAAGTRGARPLRRDAVRHREWRAERIGALCHRVRAVRASATENGAEEDEDEAGAAFKWKWNIDDGNSSRNASAGPSLRFAAATLVRRLMNNSNDDLMPVFCLFVIGWC